MTGIKTDEEHNYTFTTEVFGLDSKGQPIKVKGKAHYKKLMAMGGHVPYEEALKIAQANKPQRKEYKPSPLLQSFLRHLSCKTRNNKGEIMLAGREIAVMKKIGVNFDDVLPEYIKKNNPVEGGFCDGN